MPASRPPPKTKPDRCANSRLMKALTPGDVVMTPAVDRLSRDTTDLLVIARDMQRAGAGIRSLAEPFLHTTSDFAEIIFAILVECFRNTAPMEVRPRHRFYNATRERLPRD